MLAESIGAYREDEAWMQPLVEGAQFATSTRARFAVALLAQAHEHAISIRSLLEMPRPACRFVSAGALVRSVFECVVRGLWIADCADDQQVKDRSENDEKAWRPELRDMAAAVDKVVGSDFYSKIATTKFNAMCSFVHGGLRVVANNLSADWVEATSTEEQWAEVVAFAHAMDLLATHAVLTMSDRAHEAPPVLDRAGIVLTTRPGELPKRQSRP